MHFCIVANVPRLAVSAGFYAQNYQADTKLKIFISLSSYTKTRIAANRCWR